jgi:exonuclease VII small subunit
MENLKNAIDELKICKRKIAKERDKMRKIMSKYDDIIYVSDEAVSELEQAIDTLSQYL